MSYYFQLSTGMIIQTEQKLSFNEYGQAINRAGSSIIGTRKIGENSYVPMYDISFNKKDIIISWEE